MQHDSNKSKNLDAMVFPTGKLKMSNIDSRICKK